MGRRRSSYDGENPAFAQLFGCLLFWALIVFIYSMYKILEPPSAEEEIRLQSFVTLMQSDLDLVKVKVLGYSLLASGTIRRFTVLISEEVSSLAKQELVESGFGIHSFKHILDEYFSEYLKEVEENDPSLVQLLHSSFDKLRVWQLPYNKIVFIDPDCLVLRNVDQLFEDHSLLSSSSSSYYYHLPNFAAVSICCDQFNEGLFLTQPSYKTFQHMIQQLQSPTSQSEIISKLQLGTETESLGILNIHFTLGTWHRLPFTFNVPQHYLVEHKSIKPDDIRIAHFAKPADQPWRKLYNSQQLQQEERDPKDDPRIAYLQTKWWEFYDQQAQKNKL